jgi:hypothetical protein
MFYWALPTPEDQNRFLKQGDGIAISGVPYLFETSKAQHRPLPAS